MLESRRANLVPMKRRERCREVFRGGRETLFENPAGTEAEVAILLQGVRLLQEEGMLTMLWTGSR